MSEVSVYPGAYDVFADKEAKQNVVSKKDMNKVQNAIEAIEAALGLDIEGNQSTLNGRLAVMMDDNGAVQGGSSFPGTTYPNMLFKRTDQDILYQRDNADTAWSALGSSVTNLISEWHGNSNVASTNGGIITSASSLLATNGNYEYLAGEGTVYRTLRTIYFQKTAGADTLRVYANHWSSSGTAYVQFNVDPGGSALTCTFSSASTSPGWSSDTIDISGLTNGNYYTIIVQIKGSASSQYGYCSQYLIFAES